MVTEGGDGMSTDFPSHGHIGEDGYKSLSNEEIVSIGDNESLYFTSPLSSIETEQEVSFVHSRRGEALPKEFSIKIGRNTPLFLQIQKIPKKNQTKQSAAIKALLIKYSELN